MVLEHLRGLGLSGRASFHGDDAGWTSLEVEADPPLIVQCYLSSEPGIRAELNSWAAWLETCDSCPDRGILMERVIQTQQLYTFEKPSDREKITLLEQICESLCRYLAGATSGMWQLDGEGFFDSDGTLLLREE